MLSMLSIFAKLVWQNKNVENLFATIKKNKPTKTNEGGDLNQGGDLIPKLWNTTAALTTRLSCDSLSYNLLFQQLTEFRKNSNLGNTKLRKRQAWKSQSRSKIEKARWNKTATRKVFVKKTHIYITCFKRRSRTIRNKNLKRKYHPPTTRSLFFNFGALKIRMRGYFRSFRRQESIDEQPT